MQQINSQSVSEQLKVVIDTNTKAANGLLVVPASKFYILENWFFQKFKDDFEPSGAFEQSGLDFLTYFVKKLEELERKG